MTTTTKQILPFSPTLVEYLLWNVMCTLDTINNDFDRLSLDLTQARSLIENMIVI